jgi:alkanesulfonate monooxygenase SsuD/methylene tetrahydromethanopterin reductase-like flavin-dependent oxidoreductase (luciferase family)
MKFGLMTQIQMPRPWEAETERRAYWDGLDQAAHAEAVGFDYFWITEQHFYVEIGHSCAPEMFLAALSQRTTRMRLGFGVILLPCHHPFLVAERVATLDILSNGRAEFGVGRGTAGYIVEGFGVDPADGRGIADESLEAVMMMFADPHFPGYKGKHFDLPPRQVIPRPIQTPHPPLWAAASNLETYARAAERGVGVLGVTRNTPEETRPAVEAYWDGVRGADPKGFAGVVANPHCGAFAITCCDADDRAGRARACELARWYYGDNDAELNRLRFGSAAGVPVVNEKVCGRTDDELIADAMVIGGDADTCSRAIERWAEIGLDQMVFMIQAGPARNDEVMRSIDLLGEKVIPRSAG